MLCSFICFYLIRHSWRILICKWCLVIVLNFPWVANLIVVFFQLECNLMQLILMLKNRLILFVQWKVFGNKCKRNDWPNLPFYFYSPRMRPWEWVIPVYMGVVQMLHYIFAICTFEFLSIQICSPLPDDSGISNFWNIYGAVVNSSIRGIFGTILSGFLIRSCSIFFFISL